MHIGGRQNKDDVFGRLLHRFEQRVERRCGQHMDFVDDIYFILADRGQIRDFIAQVADVIHAVVGGGVHLDDVHNGAVLNALADGAFAAGVGAGGVRAVDRLGKNFGAGGLAGAARAGEQVGVTDAPGGDLVLQRGDDGSLPHHVGKAAGTPFAV